MEIKVSNCDDYKATVSLGGKSYTGVSSLGSTEILIEDISIEEKLLVIKLVGSGMKEFRKSLRVKKGNAGVTPKDFDVKTLKLWGRDIKEKTSIVVNATDTPKVLEVEVSNCDDYAVSANLGGQTYTGNAISGKVQLTISDIPEEEKTLVIKLVATGMNDLTKNLNVKKDVSNTQSKDFDVKAFKLWGRDIKEKTSMVVNAKDTPKVLEVEISNCDNYTVNANLGEQTYTGNTTSGKVQLAISDIPEEEKTLVIKLVATGMNDFTKSLNVKKDVSNTQPKDFDVKTLKLWGQNIKEKDSIVVNAVDTPKVLEIEVSNCDDYDVTVNFEGKIYRESGSIGNALIAIKDIPTEEKQFEIKLTATGMKEFTKSLQVKKDVENEQPKEFDIQIMRLWGRDIKNVDSIVVNAEDMPKELFIESEAHKHSSYNVTVSLDGKTYTGESAPGGINTTLIDDIPTEEKLLVIKLTARGMRDFTKSLRVRKDIKNEQPKEFDVKFMRLWDRNILGVNSIVVNDRDKSKTLIIGVSNFDDFTVSVKLGERDYTKNVTSGWVQIPISDIPEEEKVMSIKISANGVKEWNKKLKVRRGAVDFELGYLSLWSKDIAYKNECIVDDVYTPKTLNVGVKNCDEYLVTATLGGKEYKGNAILGKVEIPIEDIPTEEKELTIKLSATGMKEFSKTIKVKKEFNFWLTDLFLWGHNIEFFSYSSTAIVYATDTPKTLKVGVMNCDEYLVTATLGGKEYKGNATLGNVEIPIEDIPTEEKELSIKLTATGVNDFIRTLKVKKEFKEALDLKVFFKTEDDNIEREVVKGGNNEFQTTKKQGEVIIRTTDAVMSEVLVNGSVATLSLDKKTATYNIDTNADVDVNVEVEFVEFKKALQTFKVKKYASQDEIPFKCTNAKILSGNDKATILNFDSNNVATVSLNDIQYSCVKLVMDMSKSLATATLEECRDERSSTYSTNPTENDLKGIFSGRLKAELDKDGKVVKEYKTPVVDNRFTEYLIVGAGTVEYDFKLTSTNGETENYTVKITNAKNKKVPTEGKGRFMYSTADTLRLFSMDCWTWENFTKLPAQSKTGKTNMEYMGDDANITFFRADTDGKDLIYFYHNVFDNKASKKHEFIRQVGDQKAEDIGKGKKFYYSRVNAVIQPEEKYVDAFVAYKDFLPSALNPMQTNNKWKKILEKGFTLQVRNGGSYQTQYGGRISTLELFFEAFSYRVQAKIYEKGDTLAMGVKQNFEDFTSGQAREMSAPFLMGGNGTIKNKQGQVIPIDRFLMFPTFGGKMEDSIQSISYTIKKNKSDSTTEFENVTGWENVNLTPSKWQGMLVLGATDDSLDGNNVKEETLYLFEKGADNNENIYMVDVKVITTSGVEEKFNYKINYRGEESVENMGMSDGFDDDSDLFGVPTYYASEDAVVSRILQKAMYERQRAFQVLCKP